MQPIKNKICVEVFVSITMEFKSNGIKMWKIKKNENQIPMLPLSTRFLTTSFLYKA